MNEFEPHDYFNADDQGYISRKVFIEHVRNSYDHMRELSALIKGYDQTIDTYLDRWDQNLESLDDSIIGLLHEWIDDSTFATIINEEIFKTKADQVDLEEVTAQLAQTSTDLDERGINLKSLGLKGDGTDETSVLQTIITNANENDLFVLPEGTYIIKQVDITKSIRIKGVGKEKVKINGIDKNANLFNLDCDSFSLEDVTLENFNFAVCSSVLRTMSSLYVHNCNFRKINRAIFFGSADTKVNRLIIKGNLFDTISYAGIYFKQAKNVFVENNVFNNIVGSGSALGVYISDVNYSNQLFNEKINISNNFFDTIRGGSGVTEIKAILIEGKEVIISGNNIKNVTTGGGYGIGEDCEGIYTKAINGIVNGNILLNAGENEGGIVCKGATDPNSTTSQTNTMIITNNIVVKETPILSGSYASIRAQGAFVNISNNILKGVRGTISLNSTDKSDIIIDSNQLIADVANIGVFFVTRGFISNNIIKSTNSSICVDVRDSSNVEVKDNFIQGSKVDYNDVGIRFYAQSRDSLNNAIKRNTIDTSYFGLASWVADTRKVTNLLILDNVLRDVHDSYSEVTNGSGVQQYISKVRNLKFNGTQYVEDLLA